MAQPKTRKITILGDRAVGKSSLTIQYVENHFVDSYYPTIENTFTKTIKYRGQEFVTEIIDTAGQDEYSIMNPKHATGIHGYVLVFSITQPETLENCKVIRDKILDFTGTDWVPIVIVGNKCDLHMQRKVSLEIGQKLAEQWNCVFLEASAKHNVNINRIFEEMINEIEKAQNPKPAKESDCIIL